MHYQTEVDCRARCLARNDRYQGLGFFASLGNGNLSLALSGNLSHYQIADSLSRWPYILAANSDYTYKCIAAIVDNTYLARI